MVSKRFAANSSKLGLARLSAIGAIKLVLKRRSDWKNQFPQAWQAELGAKENLGRPASCEAHAFFEVAVAGGEFERFFDESLRSERDQVGLIAVDALVVSGVERAGFFWIECEIAEALTGAHFPWAQDQMIGLDGADRFAVLGEGELDGG